MRSFPIGTKFKIRIDSEEQTWTVDLDGNPEKGIVSSSSPLGKSLLRTERKFTAPCGEIEYEIVSIKIAGVEHQFSQISKLIEEIEQLSDFEAKAVLSVPRLDLQDIQLALEWCDPQYLNRAAINLEEISHEFLEEYGQSWELGRVLSARAAEKAAMEFYRSYGCQVEDVSIRQIAPRGDPDWKDYDLLVNGHPVDVKNSRRSRRNKNNYVEHCIPGFKENRTGQAVEIAGVLSPYLWPRSILDPQDSHRLNNRVIFLGTTTLDTVSSLKREFNRSGFFQIQLSNLNREGLQFFPAWIFDYPDFVYESRNEILDRLAQIPASEYKICEALGINPIPIWLSSGVYPATHRDDYSSEDWECLFMRRVLDLRMRYGLSRPFLFLTVLTHFLEMASGRAGQVQGYCPEQYRKLIYYRENVYTNPLFIFDPLQTISALISALNTMWVADHSLISRFQVFKLQNRNILRGRFGEYDDQWKTLLAYCGGWISNKERCGENPLVLGRSKHCLECGRLVCTRCGFCSESCSLCKERRATFSEYTNQELQNAG